MNYTIPTEAFDINNNTLFNPSCISDLDKFADMCTDFRVRIIETVNTRFKIALILLAILIFYKIYTEYDKPAFSQTEYYKKYVAYRIDFAILIVLICTIGLMFI